MKSLSMSTHFSILIILLISCAAAYCMETGGDAKKLWEAGETINASAGAQKLSEKSPRTTEGKNRYLSFNIWGWNNNGRNMKLFKGIVESAKAKGFNTISLAFAWSTVERSRGIFDFTWLDQRVDYIVQQGLNVQLRVTYTLFPRWIDSNYVMRKEDGGIFIGSLSRQGMLAISDEQVRKWMETLIVKTVEHYQNRYSSNPVLYYSISIGPVMETEYAFETYLDYSHAAQKDFQDWLQDRYKSIDKLNKQWNTSLMAFSRVNIPGKVKYGSTPWADWMKYRSFALKRLLDQLAKAVHSTDPDAETGVQFAEYAMRFDSGARGTYDVAKLVENIDWVIFEDGPAFDHRFSMDLLRTIARGKRIGQELSPPAYSGSPVSHHMNQANVTFDYGGDLVLFANWDWSMIGGRHDRKVSFQLEDAPINNPAYAKVIAKLVEKTKQPVSLITEPQVALYVSTMMQYLHPKCNCPGFINGVMLGVDTYKHIKKTYLSLTNNRSRPIAIITDHIFADNPSVLNRYTQGIYLPAFNHIIADETYNALTKSTVPLYAENRKVGTRNEYGDARTPSIFKQYPGQ